MPLQLASFSQLHDSLWDDMYFGDEEPVILAGNSHQTLLLSNFSSSPLIYPPPSPPSSSPESPTRTKNTAALNLKENADDRPCQPPLPRPPVSPHPLLQPPPASPSLVSAVQGGTELDLVLMVNEADGSLVCNSCSDDVLSDASNPSDAERGVVKGGAIVNVEHRVRDDLTCNCSIHCIDKSYSYP